MILAIDMKYMPLATKGIFEVLDGSNFIKDFALVGGTALSLKIGHWLSEDLDFVFDGELMPQISVKKT